MLQKITDFLITIPIFDHLSTEELQVIAKYIKHIDVNPGEIVFEEGDKGDYVCFVVDGILDVIKKSITGENIVISTLPKGRSIGEMSIIDDFNRSATVRACTKATLVTLSREKFNYIMSEHPAIGVKILKAISRLLSLNLRKTSSRLADYMMPLG